MTSAPSQDDPSPALEASPEDDAASIVAEPEGGVAREAGWPRRHRLFVVAVALVVVLVAPAAWSRGGCSPLTRSAQAEGVQGAVRQLRRAQYSVCAINGVLDLIAQCHDEERIGGSDGPWWTPGSSRSAERIAA